jgi:hypothetical protein
MIFSWKKIGVVSLIIITLLIGSNLPVSAQSTPAPVSIEGLDSASAAALEASSYESSVNEGDFEFEISPENPGPYTPVSIKLSSNLVDTNRYPITWNINGVAVKSGVGERVINISTKNYGEAITIVVTIELIDSTITKQAVLIPQDVTLIWEAVYSYAPPFYEGKRLPSYESLVRIVSIPNFLGNRPASASKNAVYNWSRNKSIIPNAGGYGKDSILIEHNRVRPSEYIQVTSSSTSGSNQAMGSISIPFFNPIILFYERNAATGIRNLLAKNNLVLNAEASTIEAEPYFFSVINNNPNSLKIDWTMNSKPIALLDARKKTALSIKKPDSSGNTTIGVTAENVNKLFQTAQKNLSVVFIK